MKLEEDHEDEEASKDHLDVYNQSFSYLRKIKEQEKSLKENPNYSSLTKIQFPDGAKSKNLTINSKAP